MDRHPFQGARHEATCCISQTAANAVIDHLKKSRRGRLHRRDPATDGSRRESRRSFLLRPGLTRDDGEPNICLPPQFLLELGALLQFQEWQDAGVVQWSHPDGLTIDDLISQAIQRLQQGQRAFAGRQHGTEAMVSLVRTWTETCSPVSREHLDCDIAIEWDGDGDIEQLVEALAEFAWRHRDRAHGKETVR